MGTEHTKTGLYSVIGYTFHREENVENFRNFFRKYNEADFSFTYISSLVDKMVVGNNDDSIHLWSSDLDNKVA